MSRLTPKRFSVRGTLLIDSADSSKINTIFRGCTLPNLIERHDPHRVPPLSSTSLLLVVAGLALLVIGADSLVSGASRIARRFGVPPLIVGLTIVAVGTSAPEIVVSTTAALGGYGSLALGNVVGSNIYNVLLILGITAVILPLTVSVSLIRQEVPVMIGLSVLLLLMLLDGLLSAVEAGVLLGLGTGYILLLIVQTRRVADRGENVVLDLPDLGGWSARLPPLAALGFGLVALVVGARMLVSGATDIALALGVDEVVIGLTVVAIGTSLPEIAAGVAAVLRGERDLAIGNVIGSNVFNIALCLGLAGLLTPSALVAPEQLLVFDLRVMVIVALVLLPLAFTGYVVSRVEGGVLLGWSVVYLAWTVLAATASPLLSTFSSVALFGLLPATGVYLCATVVIALRDRSRSGHT